MATRAVASVVVSLSALFIAVGINTEAYGQTLSPIQIENAKPGATDWKLTKPGYATGTIEGYASATAVNRGGTIKIFVNTTESSYTMDIYRLGYYGGAGARKMLTVTLPGIAQPTCPMDAFGTVDCNWINPYVLNVPTSSDPTVWMSGIYLVKLTTGTTLTQQYAIFVVRDDSRASDILMIESVNTYQAYNVWGGKSLYGTLANPSDTANKAEKVSFNRPYYANGSYGTSDLFGGLYTGNELGMLTWLEQHGYDVTYATDPDLDSNPSIALSHKMVEIVGHTEYWSWGMRDTVEGAIAAGVNLASFAGNVSFWQIRYEASLVTGDPYRTIVGYKEHVALDPLGTTQYATTEWRYKPVNRPEDFMTGTMFVTKGRPLLCIEDQSSWVLTGTGLQNGQCIGNADGSSFLGPELDYVGPDAPADIQRVGHSPAATDLANFSDMTVYRAPSGATVFSSGSIGWSETTPAAVQILQNVLSRMLTGAFADTTPIRPALPSPFQSRDIGPVGRAGFVSLVGPQSFTMNGDGQTSFSGQDAMFYVYQQWTGDGQMTVRLNHLQELWGSQAGVMIRETLDPTAKDVSLAGRSSEGVVEGADLRAKNTIGGTPATLASINMTMPNWLKLVRIGNMFYGLVSADGVTWSELGSVSVPMASSVYVGAFINPDEHNVWQTADFDQVSVSADTSLPLDTTPPTVSITAPANGLIVSGTTALTATATDNVGVAKVQFVVDGSPLGPALTVGPYSFSLNTLTLSNTAHTISAAAYDAAGNEAWSSVTVTVDNASLGSLPAGWSNADIGAVGLSGTSSYNATSGTFTVTGAGADIWNTADAFQYAYTQMTGDARIVAQVASVSNGAAWVKVGVMIRQSLDPSSPQALMLVSNTKGLAFQRRVASGGLSTNTGGGALTAPWWVRLDRIGSTITAYQSADGVTWTQVGQDTIPMTSPIYYGLAVSSHTATATATGTIDHVDITPILPTGWSNSDVGVVGVSGNSSYDSTRGTFTVTGAGADVWNTADAFQYAFTQMTGNTSIVARVAAVSNGAAWVKVGVMIRQSLDPSSPQAFVLVSNTKGLAFQRRVASGGLSTNTGGGALTAPWWVRLDRIGNTVTAYQSPDGVTWTEVGQDTIPMASQVYFGLAVSSHTTTATATGTIDHVSITSITP